MNREIKFRGKRIDTGEWVYGYPSPEGCGQFSIGWIEIGGGNITNEGDYECWHSHKVVPSTISQYTGLKDKNGKEIYEGDIVKAPAMFEDAICEVYWVMNCWYIRTKDGHSTGLTNYGGEFAPEVIGNVFDNPELLN